jgi:hypothetical protein
VLYLQDADGDENWHTYASDLATGVVRDMTPAKLCALPERERERERELH